VILRTYSKRSRSDGQGAVKWTGTRVEFDLWFSNSELRAIAEVYASGDSDAKVLSRNFVFSLDKVMNLAGGGLGVFDLQVILRLYKLKR